MKRLTIGVIAHVDSGKTTLSESILYKTGVLHKLGSVNKGDSFLDTNSIERDRGITIFSSGAVFNHKDTEFTLIDTPGHVDFSPETERVLRIIDCAVLVISATDGVQSHTSTLWKLLDVYRIPTFIFINKMDLTAIAMRDIMDELKYKLSDGCINFNARTLDSFSEELAMCDETLMETYLAEKSFIPGDIACAVSSRKLFPCYFGSALKGDGVTALLDGLDGYIFAPDYSDSFGARVYKITQDKADRVTHIKLTGGHIKVKDTVEGPLPDGTKWCEKINTIRIYSGEKYKSIGEASSGMVCALTGLTNTYPGMGLGFEKDSGAAHLEPVLSYKVELPSGTDIHTALVNFRRIEAEEPALNIFYNEQKGEIYFGIMGEVQLEVLTRIIKERFGIDITFSEGSISYKETVRCPVVGVGHYEPLRHYAEVQLLIEPLERGQGLIFEADSDCGLEANFRRLVMSHLHEKTHIGVLTGSPITDLRITLIAGRSHIKHTVGGDFRQATLRALRQGLMMAESVLLEPWYDFKLELPPEAIGRAMSDITLMGGKFGEPENGNDCIILTGSAPVSKMRSYHKDVIGYTKGCGRLITTHHGYEECPNTDEIILSMGYDPERDLENTADSVFCEHGAGFTVNWKDVPGYKHVDSGVELGEEEADELTERARRYMQTVADNDELMRIFESVYGPIKRKKFNEPHMKIAVPQKKSKPHLKKPSACTVKEYLIIDGYNIIYAWDELRALSEKSLDLARGELINRICNYQGFKRCEVIIVFDAYKVKRNPGETDKLGGVTVVYTKEAETADTYIERTSHVLAKTHRVRVATSDAQEQLIILGSGAIRVSANGLRAEVMQAEKAIQEFLASD